MPNKVLIMILIASEIVFNISNVCNAGFEQHGYPRIMGMNIARPAYYDTPEYQKALSKPDIIILGFWEGWGKNKKYTSEREVIRNLKKMNPKLLVGQYTILNEWKDLNEPTNTRPELSKKLDVENWWLRDEKGDRVRWTDKYRAWDINITAWTKPDNNGERYPEWLAKKDYETFFRPVPEFDIWYFDNALSRPAVKKADWDGNGEDDSRDDLRVAIAYRQGNAAHWETAIRLHPKVLFIGNSDDVSSREYSMKLQGVFMEAVIGAPWSMERWKGWKAVMERYRLAIKHTKTPHIVCFNVRGKKDDYRRMRYGLASCLMDNGYFCYTDVELGYGSVCWFDEYDIELGAPLDIPPLKPWRNGVYLRRFEHGIVLVNPSMISKTVIIPSGFRHFWGKQAPKVNNGAEINTITLSSKDGIILVKD